MFDIVSLGELLIDFTPHGSSDTGNYIFEANPGGAPCNVLAAMSKLSKSTAFIGKIGTDTFGQFLKNTLEKFSINTSGLVMTPDFFTTLAFVTLSDDGNRSFAFSRNNSADVMLMPNDVDENLIKSAKIFHCGTLSLTHENSKAATIKALKIAKENNVVISVDPNLRLPLWKNKNDAKYAMELALSYADIIKISDYEIEFLCGHADVKQGALQLFDRYKPKIMFATCGSNGAYLIKNEFTLYHPCFDVKTIDTTGAGDSFCGSALSYLLDENLDFMALSEDKCKNILRFASAAASLTTTKYGAMCAMPSSEEISTLLKSINTKMFDNC